MLRKCSISLNDRKCNECVFVAKAVASSIETLLGTGKSLKCCELSGSSILTGSTPKILENVDIQHPAGFIINTACQSFQRQFGCGTTTLTCMIGYWTGALQDLSEMGVPTSIIVRILDEIADELENILQRSCIPLRSIIEEVGDESMLDRNVSSLHQIKSKSNVSGKCLQYPEICDESTTCSKDDPKSNAELLTASGSENNSDSNRSFRKTDSVSQSLLQVCKPSTYSVTKHPLANYESSPCRDTVIEDAIIEDEFDSCFDGLVLSEKTPGNVKRSDSAPTSPLTGERKSWEYAPKFNSGTIGIFGSEIKLKQGNADAKSSGIRNSDLSTNDYHFRSVSVNRRSTYGERGDELFANTKIYKVTNVKNVLVRSRHLSDHSTSTLLQGKDNAECTNISGIAARGCNEVSNNSNSVISKENWPHKFQQSSYNITYKACEKETEGSHSVTCQKNEYWLDFLGRSLAHGKENEMALALEVLKRQFTFSEKEHREFSFETDLISVQTVLGSPVRNSCIVDGAVVELSKENQSIVACDPDTPRRLALVKGDITFKYRHPGFKDSVEVTRTFHKDDLCQLSSNVQIKWMDRVMLLIRSLNLGVIAVHGHMTSELRDHMQALGVIVLENLSNKHLDVLSRMTGTSIVSYILDVTAHDVGKSIVMRIWDGGWASDKLSTRSNSLQTLVFAQICLRPDEELPKLDSAVCSVVLCGPVQDLVDDSELKFWNCVHRLRNAFEDLCVLPGGGDVERICLQHLEDIRDCKPPDETLFSRWIQSEHSQYRPLLIDAICSGLKQFVARTNSNINMMFPDTFSSSTDVTRPKTVYDNYICKVEGWKRAIRIVKLFLNSEYRVVTGL